MGKGLFITLEGGEGAGKSTQAKNLSAWLSAQNIETVLTREPGGTPEAEVIRNLIVKSNHLQFDVKTEALLMTAARREHIVNKIQPALAKGIWVICDRFFDSTVAYQGYAGGVALSALNNLYHFIADDLEPDITFIFDLPPALGLERSLRKLSQEQTAQEKEDRFEKRTLLYHEKLRQGFLEIAKNHPKRCHILDATQDIKTLEKGMQTLLYPYLPLNKDKSHG